MNLSEKTKMYFIGLLILGIVLLLFHFIGEIILPFILALFISYLLNPIVIKIQKVIKNRNLAITSFLIVSIALVLGIFLFLGTHFVNDSKRFVNAVELFEKNNKEQINDTKNNLLNLFNNFYDNETIKNKIKETDLLDNANKETITSALKSIYSFFESSHPESEKPKKESWNFFSIVLYTLIYVLLILYTYNYFQEKYTKYFKNNRLVNNKSNKIWQEFKIVFINYFNQRLKIVIICTILFIITFSAIGLPGAIIIGVLAGVLTYADHFHYLSLPPIAIGCWILSIENNTSFYVYFGIILCVFILVSILEETIFFKKIMKSVNGMNPAVMTLSFVLWIYIFGGFVGTVIALPLTRLIMIYIDNLFLYSKNKITNPETD